MNSIAPRTVHPRPVSRAAWLGFVLALAGPTVTASPSAFTWQGLLQDSGTPVTHYDFEVQVFDADAGGSPLGAAMVFDDVAVEDGRFLLTLDPGNGVFTGDPRWLELRVRRGDALGGYTQLLPRQPVHAQPYAQHAQDADFAATVAESSVGSAQIAPASVGTGQLADASVTATKIDATQVQRRISGTCPAGHYLTSVGVDGAPGCAAVDGSAGVWSLSGNAGTDPAIHYLGTSDAQPLQLRTNGEDALRVHALQVEVAAGGLDVSYEGANLVAGGTTLAPDLAGSVLLGGSRLFATDGVDSFELPANRIDAPTDPNAQPGHFASITGGVGNVAAGFAAAVGGGRGNAATAQGASVAGGEENRAEASGAAVAGGNDNQASGSGSFIGGGASNLASGTGAAVGGGWSNQATATRASVGGGWKNRAEDVHATIAGGEENVAVGSDAAIGGGYRNSTSANYASIAGGFINEASGEASSLGGGWQNLASARYATVGGGYQNSAQAEASAVTGGRLNRASGEHAFAGGGESNVASGEHSSIAGGLSNSAAGNSAAVGGGSSNAALAMWSQVAGGGSNSASGAAAAVAGGTTNTASGEYAFVGGGRWNCAGAHYSWAAGHRAKVRPGTSSGSAGSGCSAVPSSGTNGDQGSFVWADYRAFDFLSTGPNRFEVRATGGVRFVSGINATTGAATTGVSLAAGSGSWASLSDRHAKTDVEAVEPSEVLARVLALPIYTWRYRAQGPEVRHMGPMAQDFHAAFGLNGDDDTRIATVDPDGAALAAIQGLFAELQTTRGHLDALREEIATLRAAQGREQATLDALLRRVAALEARH